MSLLEEKIRKNRDSLDAAEPMQGHLERFEARLDGLHGSEAGRKRYRIERGWKVAAVILVLLSFSISLYFINPGRYSGRLSANPLPAEIQEVKVYYQSQTDKKLKEIDRCSLSPDQAEFVRQLAEQELLGLDSNSANLEEQLRNDQENPRIRQALIINYKTKAELIEDIIKKVCKI